jgi:hypothetical protein
MTMGKNTNTTRGFRLCRIFVALLITVLSAHGQRFEITPLVGGMFGGTVKLEEEGVHNFEAHLQDRFSFGIAGGVHYNADDCDGCNLIEFRWMRQNTHLTLAQDPLVVTPAAAVSSFRPSVTLDHFLGDFTREWTLEDAAMLRPFLTITLGAARMATPAASATRFVFGIGTGLKVFLKRRWGIRFQVEYLPIVMHADLERVVCAGGCIVALSGGVMNQFQVSVGPAFRF